MNKQELYNIALKTIRPVNLKSEDSSSGQVACALESKNGEVFTGVCIDMPCSLGFCAEQAAAAEMLKNGETKISKIIAVCKNGSILPPCGRCREFISQLDNTNSETIIILPDMRETKLKDLLPEKWDD